MENETVQQQVETVQTI